MTRSPADRRGAMLDRLFGSDRRTTLPLVVAGIALLFALLGAIGPADHLRTRYAWPPHDLPGATPQRLWYAPLLLTRHQPESISAEVPCSLPPALTASTGRVTVLATARDWASVGGLAITRGGGRARVQIGGETLATVPVSGGTAVRCAYHLLVTAGGWSLRGGPGDVSMQGSVGQMPTVVGLFSALDLRSGTPPSIVVTTAVHGTKARARQAFLWSLAALGALAALFLVLRAPSRRPRSPAVARAGRRLLANVGLPDVVVTCVLISWWLIGPAFFDDGWVIARQGNFASSGGFSAYYSSFGVDLPLDYWLEWVEHWLVQSSNSLLVFRLPALVCLGATWALCRWTLGRVSPGAADRARNWALASAFIVGALAWGMTFRPEPVLALLVVGVLAATVRFVERESAASLVLAVVLVVLALSAHPAGIVAIAPLAAVTPLLYRWVRPRPRIAATIAMAAAALLAVLVTVGSDLAQRRADTASLRAFGDETASWRDELTRYTLLSQSPYGTPLRRESVALIVAAVVAFLLRRRWEGRNPLLGLPAASLGVALVLFFATPTKWPWHFGALIGLAALAVAAETARLREDGSRSRSWDVRPFLVLAAAVAVAGWAWEPRLAWGDLDLRTLHWTLGFERRLTLARVAGAAPFVLLALIAAVEIARRRERLLPEVPWRAAAWAVPVVAVPLVAFTAATFAADTAKTHSWTLARQNFETLAGDVHCGLADDALVPMRSSMHALRTVGSARLPAGAGWLPPAPVAGVPRFALGPPPARSPWFRLAAAQRMGFFVSGIPSSGETFELEWGRVQAGRVKHVATGSVSVDFASDAQPESVQWRFYSEGDLPAPPTGANAVRFVLGTAIAPGTAVGVTAPVTYEDQRLTTLLERETPSLALPNLLTYVPCVEQPRVGAVAEVPKVIVGLRDSLWPVSTFTSPFSELPDLYRLVRLPLSDSHDPPGQVAVYEVDRRIDGAAVAPPVTTSEG